MRLRKLLLIPAVSMCFATAGLADSLNIIITPVAGGGYGGYFQINNAADLQNGAWTPIGATQASWDSLNTTPGSADPGGSASNPLWVGNTDTFAVTTSVKNAATSFGSSAPTLGGNWSGDMNKNGNDTGSGDAALILTTGGTIASSSVSDLLVLDGSGQIFVYKAPTTVTAQKSTPVTQYGYTGGLSAPNSYTPGATPIDELGTPNVANGGLEGDLENNQGFSGNSDGTNIGVGKVGTYTDPRAGEGTFQGYVYHGDTVGTGDTNDLREVVNGSFAGYVSPTVYFETTAVPLPNTAATLSALLGVIGCVGYWRSTKRRPTLVGC